MDNISAINTHLVPQRKEFSVSIDLANVKSFPGARFSQRVVIIDTDLPLRGPAIFDARYRQHMRNIHIVTSLPVFFVLGKSVYRKSDIRKSISTKLFRRGEYAISAMKIL